MNRGIVIGSRVHQGNNNFSFNGAVDSRELPKWLLYWDKIAYAGLAVNGGRLSGKNPQDVQFLESEGIFRTEFVDISTDELPLPEPGGVSMMGLAQNQIPIASASARVSLTEHLSSNAGEIWSMGQSGGEQLLLPGERAIELIDIELVNCLPIPSPETPFEDILNFKLQHIAELEQLRYTLDKFRERILSSSDEMRATESVIFEISKALANIHNALGSNNIPTLSETISLYTNNPALGFWTSLGGIAAASTGIPLEVGAAAGLGLPTVCKFIKRSIAGGESLPNPSADFAYAYETVRQLR
ncbi:DUF6236 family protein [Paraglaciecola chathamensis]|uniref:DUF6236 family protein n=1 Tax=Paraglaciecola chathamensis TaxID=368405 RepID=UPI00270185B9|nr:DUF6236 family protein [Paraglaciecola chathamensis]MDO6561210.1 DUF6236 family protein [Paraglaciecola chathamensis]